MSLIENDIGASSVRSNRGTGVAAALLYSAGGRWIMRLVRRYEVDGYGDAKGSETAKKRQQRGEMSMFLG